MGIYSIKDLEQLSGIKAHTLRIWEQRYGFLQPKRTPTNIRYYDDEDLRLVMNVSYLNANGHKISRIAGMSTNEIAGMVVKIAQSSLDFPNQINALVVAMVNLDEDRFEKIISTNTLQYGFERTMLEIVYPFLQRIGILWQTGNINPAHEHFISNLIRQKLFVALDGQHRLNSGPVKKFALFLPEGELHEISLLFAAYIIKSRGHRVIYLGQSLPLNDLETIYELYRPDFFLTIVTAASGKEELLAFFETIVSKYAGTRVLAAGAQPMKYREELPEQVQVLGSLESLIQLVETQSSGLNGHS